MLHFLSPVKLYWWQIIRVNKSSGGVQGQSLNNSPPVAMESRGFLRYFLRLVTNKTICDRSDSAAVFGACHHSSALVTHVKYQWVNLIFWLYGFKPFKGYSWKPGEVVERLTALPVNSCSPVKQRKDLSAIVVIGCVKSFSKGEKFKHCKFVMGNIGIFRWLWFTTLTWFQVIPEWFYDG